MIKNNRKSNDSILKAGYRNKLRQYSDHSDIQNKSIQMNQDENKSQVREMKDGEKRGNNFVFNQEKASSQAFSRRSNSRVSDSQQQRKSSKQRALNSRVTSKSNIIIQNQAESQVERYPSSRVGQDSRTAFNKQITQNLGNSNSNKSEGLSQVNTQIQALNRLRQEYEYLKQVTSDEEYKFQSQIVNHSNINNQQAQSRRKYIYQSRDSVPVEIITNKKLSKKSTQKQIKKRVNWNPEKQQHHLSQNSNQSQSQKSSSQKQQQRRSASKSKIKSIQKNKSSSKLQQTKSSHQFLYQITTLQSALTQSSIKIQQLLTESIKNKQKLKQYNFTLQTNHRLENEVRLLKQNEKYLKKQIQLKDDEIKRCEKRIKVMKQTSLMLEKQSEIKDRQISALQAVLMGYKSKGMDFIGSKQNLNNVENSYRQALQKIQLVNKENELMKRQLQNQNRKSQLFINEDNNKKNYSYSKQHQNIKSIYSQVNEQLKQLLQKCQQKLYQLQSQNQQLKLQLQLQKNKNVRLQETLSIKIEQLGKEQQNKYGNSNEYGNNFSRQSSQLHQKTSQQFKQMIKKLEQSQSKQISLLKNQLESMNKQMLQLRKSSIKSQEKYTFELQFKIKQLQEIIKNENRQKQNFVEQVQKIKNDYKGLVRENKELRADNEKLMNSDRLKERYILEQKEKYVNLQNVKNRLENQLQKSRRQSISNLSSSQIQVDNHLLKTINQIKDQYRKLQLSYLQKAKQHEKLKYENTKLLEQINMLVKQVHTLEQTVHEYEQEIQQEHRQSEKLNEKINEKEIRLIELLNVSENNKTYNDKIAELQKVVIEGEVKLREKEFVINQLQLNHKKQLNQLETNSNNLKIKINQLLLQKENLTTQLQKTFQGTNIQSQNFQKQLSLLKSQLQQQQKHFLQLSRLDKQMMQKQIKLLQTRLYEILKQKQKLMQQIIKYTNVEYKLKEMIIKQKNNRKWTQNVDHLWMIKEAEYWNINEILNVVRQEEERK